MSSRVTYDALLYNYVHKNSRRLREEQLMRHNVAVSSAVDLIHLTLDQIDILRLYKAKQYLWEELHSVHWKDVYWLDRELFGLLSCMIVMLLCEEVTVNQSELLQMLDCGLLLGSEHTHELINTVISLIRENTSLSKVSDSAIPANQRVHCLRQIQSQRRLQTLARNTTLKKTIETAVLLDLGDFNKRFFQPHLPVVLQGCMEDWPAMRPNTGASNTSQWSSLPYLLNTLGHRTVPIETGATYLSDDSGSSFVTGELFIRQYILGVPSGLDANNHCNESPNDFEKELSSLPVGYLAQHQLLDQVPELRRDIITPDYCALLQDVDETPNPLNSVDASHSERVRNCTNPLDMTATKEGSGGEDVLVNAWLGPIGTVSPLHHDPYYNLLAQTTGYKYVRLYAPEESPSLSPMSGRMSNNSEVDLLLPDEQLRCRYPLVSTAPYQEYILGPGEMLFVPRWWWHFIVAVDRDSALQWRATHLQSQHSGAIKQQEGKETVSSSMQRSSPHILHDNNDIRKVKRPRVALVLPPPQHAQQETPLDAEQTREEATSAGTNELPYQSKTSIDELPSKKEGENVDYSFSVSFWWGKRLLKS